MANALIFLSHIHEERELALNFKEHIEAEFSGFVDVFVSSDGSSIPAGANFIKRIEDGLISCAGAIYLISPKSVVRPWINFELGAVWIRSALSQRSGGHEIPAIPMCHSGMNLGSLPAPLNNLNAKAANQSSDLENSFKSLQAALGARGQLRTDFDKFAGEVIAFEQKYTIGADIKNLMLRVGIDPKSVAQKAIEVSASEKISFDIGTRLRSLIDEVVNFTHDRLPTQAACDVSGGATHMDENGVRTVAKLIWHIDKELLVQIAPVLRG